MILKNGQPQLKNSAHRSLSGVVFVAVAMLVGPTASAAQTIETGISDADTALLSGTTADTATASGTATSSAAATGTGQTAEELAGNTKILGQRAAAAPRLNLRTDTVDNLKTATPQSDTAPGIRVGTFNFSPSLRQSIGHEATQSGASKTARTYSETELKGSLTFDWSRHQLTINGGGTFQKNISGTGAADPKWNLDAELRMDVTRTTIVTATGGYDFARESVTDANSVSGASVQAGVHTFDGGLKLEQEFGRLRGTVSGTLSRSIYGATTLSDLTRQSNTDRNRTSGELALRLGYEVSPALTPFIEASLGRTYYDLSTDSNGYARNATSWAMRGGVEVDLGEKLTGEISGGYQRASYADSRLAGISTYTLDGVLNWSPLRGTTVSLGASTSIDPSTTAGTSGYVARAFTASLSQEVTRRLVARLSGSLTTNDYPSSSTSSDATIWKAGAGLTWRANRYVDVTGDVDWQYTGYKTGTGYHSTTFLAGITLRR